MLIFIGYRACGKTTFARLFAEKHGLETLDSDELIEQRTGMPISDIFAQAGEEAFRDLEEAEIAAVFDQVAKTGWRIVLSSGGGAILREATRKRFRENGCVIWLQADAETIHRRLLADASTAERRPALTSLSVREEIEHLLRFREQHYRDTAHLALDTTMRSQESLLEEIETFYRQFEENRNSA